MANTSLRVSAPTLLMADGQPTATSLQVAEHFGKRHTHMLRAIRNLGVSEEFSRLNFGPRDYFDERGKVQPMYDMTRDGFAMLAMGFTGKEALRWKEAYITAFNAMEAKLRALYVAPLLSEKEFRNGIKLRDKLVLMDQSRSTMAALVKKSNRHGRRNLYWQLRQINDTLGIPTEGADVLLGADAPALSALEGGAA